MNCLWIALSLAAAWQEAGPDRIDKARARLLELVVKARADKQDADAAHGKAGENLKKAQQLLEFARRNVTDEASKKAAESTIPKMVGDVRCMVDQAAAASRAAAARIRLTEQALANLKSAAPSGPVAAALRKLGTWSSRKVDEEFAASHGFLSDPATEKRLATLVERLAAFAPHGGERPRIKIVKGAYNGLAAFTTTDTIYVLEDELKRGRSDEELLILMGHELAHAQLDHYASFYAHLLKEEQLEKLQGADSNPEYAETLTRNAVAARTSAYSVEQELEAEMLGAQMSIAAGVPPEKILKDLEAEAAHHAEQHKKLTPTRVSFHLLVRTHPEPEHTLKKLRDVLGDTALPR